MALTESNWMLFIIVGILSGVLSGTFGVGAGIIIIPALAFLGTAQKDAQAVSLAVMVPMALMGAWRYHANPDIHLDLKIAGLIALGALGGAVAGAYVAGVVSGPMLRKAFACFMILVAVRMLTLKS